MNRLVAVLLLASAMWLTGCAGHPGPEQRGYSAEERRELALEALNRRGLSFDEYQQKKNEVTGTSPRSFSFDQQGQINADRGVRVGQRSI